MNTLPSIHSLQAGPPATSPYDLHQQQHLAPFHSTNGSINGVGAHSRRKSFDLGHGRKSPLPHEYRQQLLRHGGGENDREQLRHQQRHHHHNGAPAMYKASPPVTPASDSMAGEPPAAYKSSYPPYAIPESSSQHHHYRQQQDQQYYYQHQQHQQQQQNHYQNHSLSNGYPHSAPSRSMMLADERHSDLEMEQLQRRQYQHQQQQYHEQHGHPQHHILREEEMVTPEAVAAPTLARKGASPASSSRSLAVPNDRPAGRRRSHAFATAKDSTRSTSASNSRKRSTSFSEDNNNNAGSTNGGKTVYECPTCHKSYKHANCLHKHKWEHTEYWAFAAQFSMSKHQQVQLLEAASILVTLGQNKKNVDGMTTTATLMPAPAPQAQRPEMMMMLGDAAAAVSAAAANAADRGGGDFGPPKDDPMMDADEYDAAVSLVPTPVPPRRIKREKSRRRSSAAASREVVA
ncbi:hypothetical protein HDU87_004586 [Geranomyces variabilis]|uniref:C2H2-type domain-containing protein n=1 Tax=Geranomyces variabilis TaxID=109894 RepID=A0AAD5XRW0_9FUNG|nr:hypothetical protein HDU87_004586 [Geranomyces variabilis]